MVKPYKPPSVAQEQELDALVPKVAAPKPAPKVSAQVSPFPINHDLSTVITQLQNIWEKLSALELLITAQFGRKSMPMKPPDAKHPGVIDDTYPPTKNGGHPVLKNGMTAPFIEVPSVEQLLSRAKAFREKHGPEALTALVKEFEVKKISELSDEQRAQFMERLG